ncbi:adenylyl-sulfate kinase [Emticicia sp. 17c]|uniref:adenylyl-sulfate kinase n=1 Tax=Emticicia sp. 17c TaxID=3127704 RepID=UPI00301E129E
MENKCLWLFGLSGAGKTTLATALAEKLPTPKVKILDGDVLRQGINKNLGFSEEDRFESVRRAAEIARLFIEEGYWVIVALITPLEAMRQSSRQILGEHYIEIFVNTPLEICEQRDPKGLYAKAATNEIRNFTGKTAPFENPAITDIVIFTENNTVEACCEQILGFLG